MFLKSLVSCLAIATITTPLASAGIIFTESFESASAFTGLTRITAPVVPTGAQGSYVGQVQTTTGGANSGNLTLNASTSGVSSFDVSFLTALGEPEFSNARVRVGATFRDAANTDLTALNGDYLFYDGNSDDAFINYFYSFVVPATAVTLNRLVISFAVGNQTTPPTTQTFLVDNVQVNAVLVPEPASLVLASVGALLVVVKRRR